MVAEPDEPQTHNEKLWEIAKRFYDPGPLNALAKYSAPFDVSKPNIHNSKREFRREKEAVENASENARGIVDFVEGVLAKDDPDLKAMTERVIKVVDQNAESDALKMNVENVSAFLAKSASQEGLSIILYFLCSNYAKHLNALLSDLEDQEREFWSGSHRPPTITQELLRSASQG